jgi:DNA-directed RNA polymerase specialized sigma24 family protein
MREQTRQCAADLHWLAFLLTGERELSTELAVEAATSRDEVNPFFERWMQTWSRKMVIVNALAAIRHELAESARRTELASMDKWKAPPREWSLDPGTTKARIGDALLAMDSFPRAVVLLLVFEGVPIAEAAALLHADTALIRKAQVIGLPEFTSNIAWQNQLAHGPIREIRMPSFCMRD